MKKIEYKSDNNLFQLWKNYAEKHKDQDLIDQLNKIENDNLLMDEFFGRSLTFGTSGLRGKLGPGPNGMNTLVIKRTTLGIANYLISLNKADTAEILKETTTDENLLSVVISYDSRIMSKEFAHTAAEVFSACGIKTYLFNKVTGVPILAFATEQLGCSMGIMITASHNPKEFNGYKVYNSDGYQIVGQVAKDVLKNINQIDYFQDIKQSQDNIIYLDDQLMEQYLQKIGRSVERLNIQDIGHNKFNVVYTPLNGAGALPVSTLIKNYDQINLIPVPSQWNFDGHFPTCPKPNPEILEAFTEAKKVAKINSTKLIIGTDPDSDRLGACALHQGVYKLLNGNQIGALLLDFMAKHLSSDLVKGKLVIKSIVSSPVIDAIADEYGLVVETKLTGFKYIGQRMVQLKHEGRYEDFLFAYEESNGFLTGDFLHDKDGISAALVLSLVGAYYDQQGKDLFQAAKDLYEKYNVGYEENESFEFRGQGWRDRRVAFMDKLRTWVKSNRVTYIDYRNGYENLPPSDVLRIEAGNQIVIVRPSGTEPLVKFYCFGPNSDMQLKKQLEALLLPYLDYTNENML